MLFQFVSYLYLIFLAFIESIYYSLTKALQTIKVCKYVVNIHVRTYFEIMISFFLFWFFIFFILDFVMMMCMMMMMMDDRTHYGTGSTFG